MKRNQEGERRGRRWVEKKERKEKKKDRDKKHDIKKQSKAVLYGLIL